MMRRLMLPLVASGLLAGCVTGDYTYRGGDGDYYYGRPRTEYRYHDPYGAYPYGGYGIYGRYGYGAPYPYRYPYYYGGYGHPYYGHPYYYRPPVVIVRPGPDAGPTPDAGTDRRPPWRDLVDRRRQQPSGGDGGLAPMPQPERPTPRPMPRSDDGGSRMQQIMRRAQEASHGGMPAEQEP